MVCDVCWVHALHAVPHAILYAALYPGGRVRASSICERCQSDALCGGVLWSASCKCWKLCSMCCRCGDTLWV